MNEDSPTMEYLSIPMLRTKMAEDLVPVTEQTDWYTAMGIVPGSEEGAAMEAKAGQARRNSLKPIVPMITLLSRIASEIMQAAILLSEGKNVEEKTLIPVGSLTMANLAVTQSVLAQLIDMGVLTIAGFTMEGEIV